MIRPLSEVLTNADRIEGCLNRRRAILFEDDAVDAAGNAPMGKDRQLTDIDRRELSELDREISGRMKNLERSVAHVLPRIDRESAEMTRDHLRAIKKRVEAEKNYILARTDDTYRDGSSS